MFKLTKNSGRRNANAAARTARVSSARMGHGRDLSTDMRRRPAFLPDTPQEQGYDSRTSRVDETA
jgi:hypothetical protein